MTPKKGRGIGAYLLVFVVLIGALVFLLTGMKGGGKETKYSDIMKYFDISVMRFVIGYSTPLL